MADYSGSISAANVAQTAAPANGSRSTLSFQNISDTVMWLSFGGAAAADAGIQVNAGERLRLNRRDDGNNVANRITVICGVIGKKYTCSDDAASLSVL